MTAYRFKIMIAIGICSTLLMCSSAYVVPNNKEFTSGGLFSDKYYNILREGTNIKIEGVFVGLRVGVLSEQESFIFEIAVPGGLKNVEVYAKRGFSKQLYSFKNGDRITVYGKTLLIRSTSRLDEGLVGKELAVKLHKIVRAKKRKR